jgi:psiF repeat
MKKFIAPAFVVAIALGFGLAQNAIAATSAAKPMTAQQSKFATCVHKSKGMKGAAHKKFMHECLKCKSTDKPAKPEATYKKGDKGSSR